MKQSTTKEFDLPLKGTLCWDELAESMRHFRLVDINTIKPLPYRLKYVKGFLGFGEIGRGRRLRRIFSWLRPNPTCNGQILCCMLGYIHSSFPVLGKSELDRLSFTYNRSAFNTG
jgi:hypothetical protein